MLCGLSKVLVCADGATSRLATQLGIVTTPPTCQCSRAYVEGGTHKLKADGVFFWNTEVLPGKLTFLLSMFDSDMCYCQGRRQERLVGDEAPPKCWNRPTALGFGGPRRLTNS